MSAPARRRPGASSPISLTPKVEPVNTGNVAAPETVATGATSPVPDSVTTHSTDVPPRAPEREVPSTAPASADDDRTVAVTTLLRRSLKLQAQTAVLRTQQEPDGYRSFAQFVNAAIERELQRLAAEYNDGAPFEQNPGPFRTGRPFAG